MRFHSVLYVEQGVAGSARAFDRALELARMYGADLALLAVLPAGAAARPGAVPRVGHAGAVTSPLGLAERVGKLVERAAAGGVSVDTRIAVGDACDLVCAEVERRDHDLVVKVAESGARPLLWRTHPIDRDLPRRCPCPVWILNPRHGRRLGVVVAAVDVASEASRALNAQIIDLAAGMAARAGAALHVVHAWSVLGGSVVAGPSMGPRRRRLRALRMETLRRRRRTLTPLLDRVPPGVPVKTSLPERAAVPGIRQVAWRSDADVVVVGHAGRSGMKAMVLGNVADRLIGRVPGSVLVVKGRRDVCPPAVRRGGAEWPSESRLAGGIA